MAKSHAQLARASDILETTKRHQSINEMIESATELKWATTHRNPDWDCSKACQTAFTCGRRKKLTAWINGRWMNATAALDKCAFGWAFGWTQQVFTWNTAELWCQFTQSTGGVSTNTQPNLRAWFATWHVKGTETCRQLVPSDKTCNCMHTTTCREHTFSWTPKHYILGAQPSTPNPDISFTVC